MVVSCPSATRSRVVTDRSHQDGGSFDRPSRATMVFEKSDEDWRCVHSHMPLNRGVPQESYGTRPVKAWE
jgi:ketosteroid isomerase-like protein